MRLLLSAALTVLALPALAADVTMYATGDDFDGATFAVESAIVDRGIHGHIRSQRGQREDGQGGRKQ